jgi:1-acyl-sn-glycerol-3-phosphate acyltransferase
VIRTLVASARLAGFVPLTALGAVALVPCGARGRRWLFRRWSRAVLRLLGVTVHVVGALPRAPIALVTNHLSYLDVPLLCALIDATFVAKADVAGWPALGPLARAVGTVFIDRSRKRDLLRVLPDLHARLAAGGSVVFFPEATSSRGSEVLRFRSPLFEAPLRAGRPVMVAALHYQTRAGDPPASTGVCWWGDMDFASHLWALMRLRGITATVELGSETLWEDDRKRLARRAHEATSKSFRSVDQGES